MLKKILVLSTLATLFVGCSDDKNAGALPPPAPEVVGSWRQTDNSFMNTFAVPTNDACNGFAVNEEGVAVYMYRIDELGQVYYVKTVQNGELVFTKVGEVHGFDFVPNEEFEKESVVFDVKKPMGEKANRPTFKLEVKDQQMFILGTIDYKASDKKMVSMHLEEKQLVNVTEAEDLLLAQATACSNLKTIAAGATTAAP